MSWYYYLEGKISFPFKARCLASKVVSPLKKGEPVELVHPHGSGRCLRARHARPRPMAGPEGGRPSISTDGIRSGRINRRGYRRLALFGGAGLLPLIYAP